MASIAVCVVSGCVPNRDCYELRRESPRIELVDRLGDPEIPFYEMSTVRVGLRFSDLPRCPDFDLMRTGAVIALSEVHVGEAGRRCDLMAADASADVESVEFGLPVDTQTLLDASGLWLNGGHLLLGSTEAEFGACRGYWLATVTGYVDALYDDPGEGSFPPWIVFRLFRPDGDPECPVQEPCVDGFSARMVMSP